MSFFSPVLFFDIFRVHKFNENEKIILTRVKGAVPERYRKKYIMRTSV